MTANEPILIGSLDLKRAQNRLRDILKKVPAHRMRRISEYIDRAKMSIVPQHSCRRDSHISRAHCMVFPGEVTKIIDFYSKNGTRIARHGTGLKVYPGKRIILESRDIVILAGGRAIFEFWKRDDRNVCIDDDKSITEFRKRDFKSPILLLPPFEADEERDSLL